jgi:hypothetical protein
VIDSIHEFLERLPLRWFLKLVAERDAFKNHLELCSACKEREESKIYDAIATMETDCATDVHYDPELVSA